MPRDHDHTCIFPLARSRLSRRSSITWLIFRTVCNSFRKAASRVSSRSNSVSPSCECLGSGVDLSSSGTFCFNVLLRRLDGEFQRSSVSESDSWRFSISSAALRTAIVGRGVALFEGSTVLFVVGLSLSEGRVPSTVWTRRILVDLGTNSNRSRSTKIRRRIVIFILRSPCYASESVKRQG